MAQAYLGNTALNQLWLGNTLINTVKTVYTIVNTEVVNWVEATGMTNPRVWEAVDRFVSGLKADNVWSKFDAIYPLITDSTSTAVIKDQFSKNLVNTNLYTLAYIGSSTVGYAGYTNGGVDSYINTNLNPSSSINVTHEDREHLSFYTAQNFASTQQGHMGAHWKYVVGVGTFNDGYSIHTTGSSNTSYITTGTGPLGPGAGSDTQIVTNATSSGWWLSSLTNQGTTSQAYVNGNLLLSNNDIIGGEPTKVNTPILLGTVGWRQDDPTNFVFPFGFSTLQYSFFSIGDYLTGTDATNAYNRVQTLQEQIDDIFGTSRAV